MSLEEEMVELSLAYHSYREENEDLRQLVRDYMAFVAELGLPATPRTRRDELQERTKALLDKHPK